MLELPKKDKGRVSFKTSLAGFGNNFSPNTSLSASPMAVVVVLVKIMAVVESAGTEMLTAFALALTLLFLKALSVWDLKVSVVGSDANCKVW